MRYSGGYLFFHCVSLIYIRLRLRWQYAVRTDAPTFLASGLSHLLSLTVSHGTAGLYITVAIFVSAVLCYVCFPLISRVYRLLQISASVVFRSVYLTFRFISVSQSYCYFMKHWFPTCFHVFRALASGLPPQRLQLVHGTNSSLYGLSNVVVATG
jgi:hypothetical protein